ncbi:hypothetical protein [Olivibacter domesticus]|uniref:hypothetical protein n=1 Tax=Olivibacter domesticus TaxID=407022 RepID=UPI00361AB43A
MVPEYRNKVDGSAVTSLVSAETQLHSGNTGIDGFTFSLGHDQAIYSRNGQYFLKMQWDGNLVLYRNSGFKALWSSKTIQPNTGATFEFKIIRGNWMINKNQSGNITTIWQSNSGYVPRIEQGLAVPYFVLQNDGNIVMYISPYPPQGWEAVIAYRTNTAGGKTSGNYGRLE